MYSVTNDGAGNNRNVKPASTRNQTARLSTKLTRRVMYIYIYMFSLTNFSSFQLLKYHYAHTAEKFNFKIMRMCKLIDRNYYKFLILLPFSAD